ncbi:hypothetical protein N658DRAFT_212581 [Parathielavia hyrcaniae]|uniref:Uncharacterized protein n=1 Tax=Parathielavia hyrcaniae TaxID=113614 RepID=A0AAN6PVP3_9PEZI|nr:hypothetical protein N658DRAFT_212581 [Parathielavia hyrcaniae]
MPPPSKATLKAAVSRRPAFHPAADARRNSNLSPPDAARVQPAAGILTTGTTAAGRRTTRITTTTAAICSAAATTSTARHPLRLRDQNATQTLRAVKKRPQSTTTPPALTASRMPPSERPSVAGHRQPTVARAVNKPPLTPKIASRAPASQPPPALATTPVARRPAPEPNLSTNASGPRDRDDLASPVSAFLSSNITPRSGTRQNRVDSVNSTPSGTPNPDRLEALETRPGSGVPGGDDTHRRPALTFSSPSEAGAGTKQDRDSKFFYASEAQKPTPQPTSTRPTLVQQAKTATFFYANGNVAPERPAVPPVPFSPPLTSPATSQDGLMSKFIYANGIPELQPAAKIGPSPQTSSGSVGTPASRLPMTRQGSIPRAASPVKHPQHATPKPATSAATSPRSPGMVLSSQSSNQPSLGRIAVEPQARPALSHARTKSGPIPEAPVFTRRVSAQSSVPSSGSTSPSHTPHPGLTLPSNPASAGFSSLLQAAEEFAEPPEEEAAQAESLDNSPTKPSPQDGPQATEDLVANARRERKVQDLEITNASLEAINRTLERQLRKQTAELRRYQRLSRSGRLSLGSAVAGSRVPSDSTVDGGGLARAGMGLDDLSEEESEIAAEDAELDELEEELQEVEEDDDDDDDASGSEASRDGDPSLGAPDLQHRKRRRDERRLQLDLSKHQQLLVDSQKINQSLKRCLGWTEELIKEGKRALAYQVRVSDVELGGRVLAPEEVERREQGHGEAAADATLGDETIYAIDALGGGSLAEADAASTWSKDPQDRDSGIELPADGG